MAANDNHTPALGYEDQQILKRGEERAKEQRLKKDLSETKAVNKITKKYLQPIMDALDAEMEASRKLPGSTAGYVERVERVGLLNSSYLAFMSCVDGHEKEWGMNTLRANIGKAFIGLTFEAVMQETREGRRLLERLEQNASLKSDKIERRQDYVLRMAEKRGFNLSDWTAKNDALTYKVGSALVLAVQKGAPDIFKMEFEKKNADAEFKQWYLVLTEKGEAELDEELKASDHLSPYFSPMNSKPRPWGLDQIGPYLSPALAFQTPLVKHASPEQKKQLKEGQLDGSLDKAVEALNTLQDVPYQINDYVVDAVDWVRKRGFTRQVKKYPNTKRVNIPELGDEFGNMSKKDQRNFMRDLSKARAANRQARANSSKIRRNLAEARLLSGAITPDGNEAPFYLPHNWDRRGRVYHISDFGHHNTDYLRAMFVMYNTSLLDGSEEWLAMQVANTYGKDKLGFDDRIAWVQDNEDQIIACGQDFKNKQNFDFWRQASEPFQFLAACNEYAKAVEHGPGFQTRLPIALDATQSGIQHYAAASQNSTDGKLVNLINNPENKPNDLYKACLVVAEHMVDADLQAKRIEALDDPVNDNDLQAQEEYELAMEEEVADDPLNEEKLPQKLQKLRKKKDKIKREWKRSEMYARLKRDLDIKSAEQIQAYTETDADGNVIVGLNRGIVKRNCMTFGYSSVAFGFAKQLKSDWMDEMAHKVRLGELDEHPFGEDDGHAAATYLAGINYEAIQTVVKSATSGMMFFQTLAKILAHENIHFQYKTPILNFPVHQFYRKEDKKGSAGRVKVYMYNHEHGTTERDKKMTFIQYTDTVDDEKSTSAISPNVIHSMDSTLLMLSTLHCSDRGVGDLMVVHDSFATTAGNVSVMRQSILDAFVELYDGYCLYSDLLEQAKALHPNPDDVEEWPEIPVKGELNIKDVLMSDYFVS